MPPKLKLNKSKGKTEIKLSKSPAIPSSSNEVAVTQDNSMSPEVQQQFELELCWCIQQLQRALNSGKLNQKQAQEHTKTLNTLMSNSTSFIKKRQVMRLTFGDYRTKMAEESKKLTKGLNLKISSSEPNKQSKFLKKAVPSTSAASESKSNCTEDSIENNLSNNISKVQITNTSSFHFVNSSNDFRFNFHVDENS